MSSAESNESTADEVISSKLDSAEANFAKLTSSGKVDKGALIPIFHQLDGMLDRIQTVYLKKKDDCINRSTTAGNATTTSPSNSRCVPPIRSHGCGSRPRPRCSTTMPKQSKKLLNQAIEGFTNSMLAMPDPNLIRENTLGRAYCERELGKFDHAEYDHAIADFKKIMEDGTGTQQYAAARQGLSTTYAKMGDAKMAAETLPVGPVGKGASGQFMLQLQTLFSAERATSNPAEKAKYHQQIVELMKTKENDKEGWAIDVSAASHVPAKRHRGIRQLERPVRKMAAGRRAALAQG